MERGGARQMESLKSLTARPDSLAQIVYSAIRQAIVDKSLAPGSEVSEVGLARILNVSKTPVREAVLRLRERQLIEQDSNRVLRIVSPSAARINNAYEIRAALEAQAAALAAQRIGPSELDELRELADLTVETCEQNNTFDFRRHDVALHERIARASKNDQLAEMTINAIEVTDVLRTRDVPATAASRRCAHEHVDLVKAISAKDSDRARAIAMQHVASVHERLLRVYLESLQENEK
jgi:DNA-binding GntR family transcriptional regulator